MQGKVALVIGGTSGIGKAAADELARRGASVAISGRRADVGAKAAGDIVAGGGTATFIPADVASESEVERLVAATVEAFGGLDYAFNTAGDSPRSANRMLHEYDSGDFLNVINVHLVGMFYAMKYELAQMLKQGRGGAIVNMSSIFGLRTDPISGPAYPAAKHGAIGLTQCGAVQYAPHGIRVNAVCPGVLEGERDRGIDVSSALADRFVSWHPLGRLGTPVEVARAVVWLLSDEASFITGAVLPIDGGNSALV